MAGMSACRYAARSRAGGRRDAESDLLRRRYAVADAAVRWSGRLLEEAERLWGFAPGIEITLEANPSLGRGQQFRRLCAGAGINRVSLGLQSLDDETLKFLGRLHDVNEGLSALQMAQDAFDRVSFDLIYARAGADARASGSPNWQQALGFRHVAPVALPADDRAGHALRHDGPPGRIHPARRRRSGRSVRSHPRADRQLRACPAYEVSNHARTGEESRHNLTYWRYQDYVGIGPGAHGRRGGVATMRHKKPENWLDGARAQRQRHRRGTRPGRQRTGLRGAADGPAAWRGDRPCRPVGPLRHRARALLRYRAGSHSTPSRGFAVAMARGSS